jgi:DNA recombination protein RmuC
MESTPLGDQTPLVGHHLSAGPGDPPSQVLSTGVLIAIGIVVAGALLALLLRVRDADARNERLVAELSGVRASSESVDRRFEELRRAVSDRVGSVESRLVEGQKDVAETLGDVREKIGMVFESSQKVERLAGDMTRLEDLLKPPKIRGTLGEAFLEQALRDALPSGGWEMGYRFPDGTIVDAVIFLGDRIVPVDSKFPLENFRRSREAEEETERKRARRDFAADVRRHVDAIREKYIRPFDGTFEFALMYVPAEAVYCEIASDEEGAALADEAVAQRVIPVSPRLLYAYLSTVALGLRGMELQKSATEILERLSELKREWSRVEEPFRTLGSHLRNSQKQYDAASRAFERFGGRLDTIAEDVPDGSEEGEVETPALPRPS